MGSINHAYLFRLQEILEIVLRTGSHTVVLKLLFFESTYTNKIIIFLYIVLHTGVTSLMVCSTT